MELIGAVGVCEMYVVRIGKLMKLMEWANSSLAFGEFGVTAAMMMIHEIGRAHV